MHHVFIVNPVAGKGKALAILTPLLQHCFKEKPDAYTVHVTGGPGEAVSYIKERAQTGEAVRFYACGGDGTLFEVVNGAYGFPHVEIASVPLGTGNDFIRLFGGKESFLNLAAQIEGTPVTLDLIRCGEHHAINLCSMGMDAEVGANMLKFKKLPLPPRMIYTLALLYCFLRKIRNRFEIQIDDAPPIKGSFLFALAGNSRWYGGGYMGAPLAVPDDGLLDFVLVKSVSRLRILSLLKTYKNGGVLELKDICTFIRGRRMRVRSEAPATVNMDGECKSVRDVAFHIQKAAIRFCIPKGLQYHPSEILNL